MVPSKTTTYAILIDDHLATELFIVVVKSSFDKLLDSSFGGFGLFQRVML